MRNFIVTALVSLLASGCSSSNDSNADATSQPRHAGEAGTTQGADASMGNGTTDAGTASKRDAAAPDDTMADASVMDASKPAVDASSPGDAQAPQAPMDASGPDAGSSPSSDAGGQEVFDNCSGTQPFDAWVSDPKLCVYVYADNLGSPRQMAFAPNGDLFVNNGKISVVWDANADGTSGGDERATFAQTAGLNHGLAFSPDDKFVYASSATTVYRFAYTTGLRQASDSGEVVIQGIPSSGHSTRSLVFDAQGRLYVSVGSASNVDTQPSDLELRSQIRRFSLPANLPAGGIEYSSGAVVASGMRNEVGLYVDEAGKLWGVENGRDGLTDPSFGGDIHNDNPAEELNLVDGQGTTFYGYPFCYSEGVLSGGGGPGTQWADPTLDADQQKSDAYCKDTANVRPPAFAMPAHWAPLGIVKYTGHSLPFTGDFIITAHGSWNRTPATGRVVARAHLDQGAVVSVDPFLGQKGNDGQLRQGTWSVRPVDVRQGPDQALYVSDDQGGRVLKVGYQR